MTAANGHCKVSGTGQGDSGGTQSVAMHSCHGIGFHWAACVKLCLQRNGGERSMSQQASAQPKAWIENLVRAYCATDRNTLNMPTGEPAWGEPLVGYARGDDPLFARLKDDIGPFYWTPEEAFHLAHPNAEVTASALSVIVYVLPQTKTTRQDQSRESRLPAERWARSRFYGEHFNCALRLYLAEQLTEAGY
ncbi:MAG: hypothetical protein JRE63_08555, partial [Deltaproteobacteria bacterium]|nr:hypothetical protein [Deltaproteobacteria bacterium]